MFVNHNNTKAREADTYGKVIEKIAEDGVCPFCSEHLNKYHKNAVSEKKFWLITDNMYPYKPVLHHKLIIYKEHIVHLNDLPREAWDELNDLFQEITKSLNISGGTLMIRFGDTHYTGASVSHLHAHLVQSDPSDQSYDKKKGITTRIG